MNERTNDGRLSGRRQATVRRPSSDASPEPHRCQVCHVILCRLKSRHSLPCEHRYIQGVVRSKKVIGSFQCRNEQAETKSIREPQGYRGLTSTIIYRCQQRLPAALASCQEQQRVMYGRIWLGNIEEKTITIPSCTKGRGLPLELSTPTTIGEQDSLAGRVSP